MRQRPSPAPRSRTALAVVFVLGAALAAGCSGGDDSAEPAKKTSKDRPASTSTTSKGSSDGASTGIASGILSSSRASKLDPSSVGEDEAACLGGYVIDQVGEDEARAISDADISTLSDAQLAVLTAGFDKCISGATMAPDLVASFYQGTGVKTAPSDAVVACVAKGIDGRTGEVVAESASLDAGGTSAAAPITLSVMDTCVPASDITALLEGAFVDAGLTQAQASCTATALSGKISITQLAELGTSSSLPPDIQATITQAAQGCGAPG
jgi:hypothetical protein